MVTLDFYELAVLPYSYFDLAGLLNKLSQAILNTILPATNVFTAVWPYLGALAFAFIIRHFTFILDSIGLRQLSIPVFEIVFPITFVEKAVWLFEGAEAVD